MRQINMDAFKSDIITSNLCNETWANLNDLVQSYDETLSNILEKHAPVQRKVIMERTKIPWFNNELKHLKVNGRNFDVSGDALGLNWLNLFCQTENSLFL
jgi:hypothetical protein